MRKGVLLINLGTPDAPTTAALRKYHAQFFSDPRVIDTSDFGRWLLRNLIILPFRSPNTAKLYKEIWTEEGSPLMVYGKAVQNQLQKELGDNFIVELGMGYGNPSIASALKKLYDENVKELIVLPLFPQYASATVGSVTEGVMKEVQKWEVIPGMKFINSFFNDPGFIDAWIKRAQEYNWKEYDHVLFSYHGLPERQIKKADKFNHCLKENCCASINEKNYYCYRAQCYETTRQMVERMNIPFEHYTVAFQSRFGKDPWLQPYLDDIIIEKAKKGEKSLLVFAPSFVADCIETIHEIGVEYQEVFEEHGGEKLQLVASLNDQPEWIAALKGIVLAKGVN